MNVDEHVDVLAVRVDADVDRHDYSCSFCCHPSQQCESTLIATMKRASIIGNDDTKGGKHHFHADQALGHASEAMALWDVSLPSRLSCCAAGQMGCMN